ncbi:hypothetical protein DH2020_027062 [Rehmannia glutinosa]|uniref:NADP-dependent oxidoreductase domain-containing protein n=1 Tax=Rehmannia glutinosa TaxID=99300 RepID=A0ABR0VZC5_REHGL
MSNAILGPLINPRIPGGRQNMPGIGVGTPTGAGRLDPSDVKSAIIQAIELGYRHLQTAISSVFEHLAIGEAIAEALERRLVSCREDLFITSKIEYHDDAGNYEVVIQDLNKFLEKLKLVYVDLYLIQLPDQKDEIPVTDLMLVWSAMEECKKLGLTKSIGVCNFSYNMLENILKHAKIPPSVNQVGLHKLLKEKEVRELCMANKISIIASYISTIGGTEKHLSSTQIKEFDFLNKIAKDGHKTADQVVLKWAYEQGAALLLESLDKEHMQEMLNIS